MSGALDCAASMLFCARRSLRQTEEERALRVGAQQRQLIFAPLRLKERMIRPDDRFVEPLCAAMELADRQQTPPQRKIDRRSRSLAEGAEVEAFHDLFEALVGFVAQQVYPRKLGVGVKDGREITFGEQRSEGAIEGRDGPVKVAILCVTPRHGQQAARGKCGVVVTVVWRRMREGFVERSEGPKRLREVALE